MRYVPRWKRRKGKQVSTKFCSVRGRQLDLTESLCARLANIFSGIGSEFNLLVVLEEAFDNPTARKEVR